MQSLRNTYYQKRLEINRGVERSHKGIVNHTLPSTVSRIETGVNRVYTGCSVTRLALYYNKELAPYLVKMIILGGKALSPGPLNGCPKDILRAAPSIF